MARKRFTAEQSIIKLREAEVFVASWFPPPKRVRYPPKRINSSRLLSLVFPCIDN